ncbi:MAG TPA: hypothetical protein VGU90_14545 [Terriglobales bacterium]|nr:hypothetical protein [Terriglobales bacterium]
MKRHRTWFSLVSFCVVTVLGAALAFALIIAGGSVALASHQGAAAEETHELSADSSASHVATRFTGMITDSHCGARHMRKSNQNSADCARACYRKGASYVLVDGNRRYTLIGGDGALNKLVGERATVTGSLQDDAILVDSASPTL